MLLRETVRGRNDIGKKEEFFFFSRNGIIRMKETVAEGDGIRVEGMRLRKRNKE